MEKEAQEAKLMLEQQLLEAKQNKERQDFSTGMDDLSEDMITSLLRTSLSSLFKYSISIEKERLETLRLQELEKERIKKEKQDQIEAQRKETERMLKEEKENQERIEKERKRQRE